MRKSTRNAFSTGDTLAWTLAVPTDIASTYGISSVVSTFDAAGTTKTLTTVIVFATTGDADAWDAAGNSVKIADNMVHTATAHVAGTSTYAEVFNTEANFLDFYAEFLNDQVIEFGVASDL